MPAGFPAHAVCDCGGVASDLDLARRMIPALADEDPARAAALAQAETALAEGQLAAADRSDARRAWLFIFERDRQRRLAVAHEA